MVTRWLRSHAVFRLRAERRAEPAFRGIDESAKVGPRLARIDDVLDAERFGRAERRGEGAELLLDLRLACLRVRVLLDLATERRRHPAFDGQRSPFCGRPG